MDSRNENRRLIGQYPFLRPWGTCPASFESTELDAMPAGWRIAFGEELCKEIMEELTRNNCVDSYRVVQIKEKHGALAGSFLWTVVWQSWFKGGGMLPNKNKASKNARTALAQSWHFHVWIATRIAC